MRKFTRNDLRSSRADPEQDKPAGIGTDGKPCPSGCESVVKDQAWWDGRPAKLAAARAAGFVDAEMDMYGWFHYNKEAAHGPGAEKGIRK